MEPAKPDHSVSASVIQPVQFFFAFVGACFAIYRKEEFYTVNCIVVYKFSTHRVLSFSNFTSGLFLKWSDLKILKLFQPASTFL